MKKHLITGITALFILVGLYAQPPGGGGGRRGPGGPPSGTMAQRPSGDENIFMLDNFPEIPDLTLQQREKVGSIMNSERKDVAKQFEKRKEIERKRNDRDKSEKEIKKEGESLKKIDKKIADIKEKSNKKIKKVLSDTQYSVFLEKRDDFKFRPRHQGRVKFRDEESGDNPPRPAFGDENGMFE